MTTKQSTLSPRGGSRPALLAGAAIFVIVALLLGAAYQTVQLSERRTAFAKLDQDHQSLSNEFAQLAAAHATNLTLLAMLQKDFDAATNQLVALSARLKAMETERAEAKNILAAKDDAIAKFTADITGYQAKIAALTKRVDELAALLGITKDNVATVAVLSNKIELVVVTTNQADLSALRKEIVDLRAESLKNAATAQEFRIALAASRSNELALAMALVPDRSDDTINSMFLGATRVVTAPLLIPYGFLQGATAPFKPGQYSSSSNRTASLIVGIVLSPFRMVENTVIGAHGCVMDGVRGSLDIATFGHYDVLAPKHGTNDTFKPMLVDLMQQPKTNRTENTFRRLLLK